MMMLEGYKKKARDEILEDFIAALNTTKSQRLQWKNKAWLVLFYGGWIGDGSSNSRIRHNSSYYDVIQLKRKN
jgi:hypothetical protein